MTKAEKFIQALKDNQQLRNALNSAFHDLFDEADILGLSKAEKIECVEALKDYIVYDQQYNNVHVYWSAS